MLGEPFIAIEIFGKNHLHDTLLRRPLIHVSCLGVNLECGPTACMAHQFLYHFHVLTIGNEQGRILVTKVMTTNALLNSGSDPYNDFISEGGKFWDRLKTVAEANNCVPNMLRVLTAARKARLRVFYPLHRRYRPGDYETWKYIAPVQKRSWEHKAFEYGTWGGEIRKDFEPQPLIVTGLIAHTCVEATVRYAAELGYEVTMVRDATAD
ncbi:MAG: isochorismatase family protein [Pyrinomonadaceae bacterium]|nr:isochorismatase family protein [Pyrinomonadaceae bacterium]